MKRSFLVLFCLAVFLSANTAAFAADQTASTESGAHQIGSVMKRGLVNFFTFPGEVVRTATAEKENHPKAWTVTYFPRVLGNLATRLVSSVNDMGVMPWYVWATDDKRPITTFFDLPDYVWQKA